MAQLPDFNEDPTIKALIKMLEDEEATKVQRGYLGASGVGAPCERQTWYQYNGYPADSMKINGILATTEGHRSEDLMAALLRRLPGIELWAVDENGEQFGFTDLDDKFQGHIDGVIKGIYQAPKTPHLWEHKSVNEKKFEKLIQLKDKFGEKQALKQWDETYFVQGQIYMGKMGLDRHYLTVTTPGVRNFISCRTEFDKDAFDNAMKKAQRIITMKSAPARITENKTFYMCKAYPCKFYDICWKE